MLNFTTEEINNAYKKVNPKVQEILNAEWVSEDIAILGKNINMRIDQISELIKLVGYIFLRLIPLSKFIEHIENELKVSHDRATEIAEKIDEVIFSKVRSEIFQMRENLRQPQQEIVDNIISPIDEQNALRDSLLREIEEHAEEETDLATTNQKKSFTDKLNTVVSNDLIEKKIDPYREQV